IYKPSPKFFSRIHIPSFERFELFQGLLFDNDYNKWQRKRKLLTPSLSSSKFLRKIISSVQKQFKESENRWNLTINDEKEFDVSLWAKCITMDLSITQVTKLSSYNLALFDTNNEIIKSEEVKKILKFSDALKNFLTMLPYFVLLPAFVMDYVPGFRSIRISTERSVKFVYGIVLNIVEKRRKELNEGAEFESDLLDHMLTAHTPMNPEYKE
ncbi:8505_t:CDS:1, partial [Cetraspora pellucida]